LPVVAAPNATRLHRHFTRLISDRRVATLAALSAARRSNTSSMIATA
jgi:hypothetical protein